MTARHVVKPTAFLKRVATTTNRYVRCSRFIVDKRRSLLKKSFIQSSISLTASLIVDVETDCAHTLLNYNYISFIDNYLATYALTNIAFFALDSITEFRNCSDEECEL